MSKKEWIILFTLLVAFFVYFAMFEPHDTLQDNVDISLLVDGSNISYVVNNKSDKFFSEENYFYRLVLTRQINMPGFVLEEFLKDLVPYGSFEGSYMWNPTTIPGKGGSFGLYLNMYRDRAFDDPILINTYSLPISFPREEAL
ncbi:hypothetical protein ACFL13_00755 [Patescibacteria group bacterium]